MNIVEQIKIKNILKKNFIKYIIVALTSFIIDIMIFHALNYLFSGILNKESIILAAIVARIISSIYNYYMNSRLVFSDYSKYMFIKYVELVVIQIIISSFLVYIINKFIYEDYATIIKIIVDSILFVINYFIQKKIIFKRK